MTNMLGHGGLNLKETELCLGLPGAGNENESMKTTGKRGFSETVDLKLNLQSVDSCLDLSETKMQAPPKEPNKDPIKPPAK